jgi:hypothetical protein
MSTPIFLDSILRKPESLDSMIKLIESDDQYKEVKDVAVLARMCLSSSATNDYLEKIGAESIGANHLPSKLGADGDLHGDGVEVKPYKKSPGTKSGPVINDDTPMKLLKSHETEKWLVFLCATKPGTQILYAVCAPYRYWEDDRYKAIYKKLHLENDTEWKWGSSLPTDIKERRNCLKDLISKHKEGTYVRSSQLSLDILRSIPKTEVSFWKHPTLPTKKLHPILREFVSSE